MTLISTPWKAETDQRKSETDKMIAKSSSNRQCMFAISYQQGRKPPPPKEKVGSYHVIMPSIPGQRRGGTHGRKIMDVWHRTAHLGGCSVQGAKLKKTEGKNPSGWKHLKCEQLQWKEEIAKIKTHTPPSESRSVFKIPSYVLGCTMKMFLNFLHV